MLFEVLRYLCTPCPRQVRALGHLSGLISLDARHRRCRRAWAPHLERCRALMLDAARDCSPRRTALVVGSGLLLDVPLEELSGLFEQVILCDVLHLPAIRRRARRLPNVDLAARDLTDLGERVWADLRADRAPDLAVPAPTHFLDRRDLDLVVSDNLLSQLPLPFLERVGRRFPGFDAGELEDFARRIVEAHLAWLGGFRARVCLIADVERRKLRGGTVLECEDPLFGAALPEPERAWDWDIAPRPELWPDADARHRVWGYSDFRPKG